MGKDSYQQQLDSLLSEDGLACQERERTTLDRLVAPYGGNTVILGAGRLGRKLLATLRAVGKPPLAFADNNKALWNQSVDGVYVYSPAEAAGKYGDTAVFIVGIFAAEAGGRYEHRVSELKALGCRLVIPFGPVLWKAPATLPHWAADLPSRILEQKDAIRRCSELWSDDASRAEYLAQLRWRLLADFEGLPPASRHRQYFPEFLRLGDNETFVDCGAYDGDSLKPFLDLTEGRFKHAICFEPDPANFVRLRAYADQLPTGVRERVEVHQAAVADNLGELRFTGSGDTGARVGQGDIIVRSVALDGVLNGAAPSYVKMDIEGSELMALEGGRETIRQHAPSLAVCAYHTPDHLWRIPLLIHSMRDDYSFFLRPYKQVWELVCYAIRPNRRNQGDCANG